MTPKPHILLAVFGATAITLCITILYAVRLHEQHADTRMDELTGELQRMGFRLERSGR